MAKKFNAELAEQVRAEMDCETSERIVELEQKRLNAIFSTLGDIDTQDSLRSFAKVRSRDKAGDRQAILELLATPRLRSLLDFTPRDEFSTLAKVRNRIEAGDRQAMLELLIILSDTLRVFETVPQDVRDALAVSIEKMRMSNADAIKKRSDDSQRLQEQGTAAKKKHAKSVYEYIAALNDDLKKIPLPKVGLGLEARANYICEQLLKFGHTKKNGEPYKLSYVRNLIMKHDKTNQT
jgi:hypothetical protein